MKGTVGENMKRAVFVFVVCVVIAVWGKGVGPVLPGAALFADTEASTNVPLPACGGDPHVFGFTLEFNGTASNAVDVAFGVDADGDGALAPEETRLVMGWDCGEWFVRNEAGGEEMIALASVVSGLQSLRVSIRVGRGGRMSAVDIRADVVPLFATLSSVPPAWLHDCSWNLCRIASHGVDAHEASFFVSSSPDGLRVIVR